MFDIGWMELLLIGVVALIVVGPKELPGLFKTVGHFVGRARGMAREFQRSMEQAADQSGLKEAADSIKAVDKLNLNSPAKSAKSYAESMVRTKPEAAAAPATEEKAAPKAATPAPDAGEAGSAKT